MIPSAPDSYLPHGNIHNGDLFGHMTHKQTLSYALPRATLEPLFAFTARASSRVHSQCTQPSSFITGSVLLRPRPMITHPQRSKTHEYEIVKLQCIRPLKCAILTIVHVRCVFSKCHAFEKNNENSILFHFHYTATCQIVNLKHYTSQTKAENLRHNSIFVILFQSSSERRILLSNTGENIYERRDGRWEGRYICGRKPDGRARYVSVYGRSRTEVQTKIQECLQTCTSESEPSDIRQP